MNARRLFVAVVALAALLSFTSQAFARETTQGGPGLKGQYYDNANLSGLKLTRTDPAVNFAWGRGSPSRAVGRDTFSARWTGQVEVPTSGTYTFYTQTNDGARLWVNGRLVADGWRGEGFHERSGRIPLAAGKRYGIRMEFREASGRASAKLLWSGPGVAKSIVPRYRLFLPGTPAPQPPPPAPQPASGRWSDPATWWGGSVPREGQSVTIPAGETVTLDTSPPRLDGLQVDGVLVFEDKDLTLRSDWIMVHGRLQVGTESAPFGSKARIVLTGSDRSENVMNMGPKVLGVMGGTLDLHGERRDGWVRLAANAQRGQSKLTLSRNPGWRAGDRIVVSSTDYNPLQAEERTVTSVSGNTLTLDRALEHGHWGTLQTFDGKTVDERAEVALLSRNVVVEGEEASSAGGFGGQVMVMNGGVARVEGTELTRMGQKNILRRYPIHFHMLGEGGDASYLRSNSLHHTYNRCVTIHGTDRLDLTGNVCHDHLGHGFFFEDGAETDNLVSGNLGLVTRRPAEGERLLPSDASPATFWITNPDNTVRGNVAAGSEATGFWLAYPEHPTGLSTDATVWPRRTPLGEFSGNVAHSNGGDGLHVDGGPRPDGNTETTVYEPRENPADGRSRIVPAQFTGFTAYKNRNRGAWIRGGHLLVTDSTFADHAIGLTFANHENTVRGSLFVGETANGGNPRSWETTGLDGRTLPFFWQPDFPIRGFEFYDGRITAQDSTFVNFQPNAQRRASALGYLLSDAFYIHPKNAASGLRFVDSERVYLPDPEETMDGDRSKVFEDLDGSVTGTVGRHVVTNNPFLLNSSCEYRSGWNAHVCDAVYATLEVGTLEGEPGAVKPVVLRREDGEEQTLHGCCADSESAESTILDGGKYEVLFNGGTPQRLRFVLSRQKDRSAILSMPYATEPKVTRWGCDLAGGGWCGPGKQPSLAALESYGEPGYYHDAETDRLYLKIITGTDYEYNELRVEPRQP